MKPLCTTHSYAVHRATALAIICGLTLFSCSYEARAFSPPDFNGDGFSDLAIGVPFERLGAISSAGLVHVIHGSASGLDSSSTQNWTQNSPAMPEIAETGDQFGYALAHGDFNGDGFDDLAIGSPGEWVGTRQKAGCVHILHGSTSGLRANNSQIWTQNSANIEDVAQPNENFGWAVAAADFNHDGYADLAIGVPRQAINGKPRAGAVHMLFGSPIGLLGVGSRMFHQNVPGVAGTAGPSDLFGLALTTGDFNGDSFADLAVGVPNDNVPGKPGAGSVNVFYGTATGLEVAGNRRWHQNAGSIEDEADGNDTFAWKVAAGDFNGDGHDDLAIGVSHETFPGASSAGAVNVIFGSVSGLTDAGNVLLTRASLGAGGSVQANDLFGWSLAVGDFNDDGRADLVIGSPLAAVSGSERAGHVHLVHGSVAGLDQAGAQVWSQDSGSVPDSADADDWFGAALASGDFNGDGAADLALAAPFEDDGSTRDAGAVIVLFGGADGLTDSSAQFWTQWLLGEQAEANDGAGWTLGQ